MRPTVPASGTVPAWGGRRSRVCNAALALVLCTWVGLAISGCATRPDRTPAEAWNDWKLDRSESVAGTDGWATLVGLQWLEEGRQPLEIPTAAGPMLAGWMIRQGPRVQFQAADPKAVTRRGRPVTARWLRSDAGGRSPDVLVYAGVRFFVIQRGERLGVRMKDPEARVRREFRGLKYFPYQPAWRIAGTFEPHRPPRTLPITDVTGTTQLEPCPGRLRFEVSGRVYMLEALLDEEAGDFFVLFRDGTSGRTTYGSGRFLHVAREDAAGKVVIDFNFAYNPPCAFTPFATCPIPPRSNWLPFEVPAGERIYGAREH